VFGEVNLSVGQNQFHFGKLRDKLDSGKRRSILSHCISISVYKISAPVRGVGLGVVRLGMRVALLCIIPKDVFAVQQQRSHDNPLFFEIEGDSYRAEDSSPFRNMV
jgi:hypothetical protein